MLNIGIIGAGNMASAIIGGIIKKGIISGQEIICSSPVEAERDKAAASFGINVTADNKEGMTTIDNKNYAKFRFFLLKLILNHLSVDTIFKLIEKRKKQK